MNWQQIGRLLRTAFLLRVPLITLAVLALIAPVSLTAGNQLLGNLFDQRVLEFWSGTPVVSSSWTARYLFSVSFAAFLAAFTAVAVINLILHYGKDRFEDPALNLDQRRPLLTFFFGIASALPLVICTALRSEGSSGQTSARDWAQWGMPILGFLAALALVFMAKIVQLIFTNPKTTPHPPPYLIFPVYLIRPLEQFFDWFYCRDFGAVRATKQTLNRISQWPLEILRCAGQGYLIDCSAPKGKLVLRSGHVFALALSSMAFATYLVWGYLKSKIDARPSAFPALTFVLLFGIVLCWVLGALTFFLDRYRVPLLSAVAILLLGTWTVPQSDHVYRVEKRHNPIAQSRISPADLIHLRTHSGQKRVILVATAGGGIQAAAWTARVLRGLEEECSKQSPQANQRACDFRDSVILISGVSGGSLGALTYARSFTDFPSHIDPAEVPANAASPALDEVAWGWMNPDVWNSILPWFRTQYVDRGWALEEKWAAVNQTYVPHVRGFRRYVEDSGNETWLGNWAGETRKGTMPALLLNATFVEKGSPLVFSSTDFPRDKDPRGLQDFFRMYPDYDIRVTTAARLSASFPFVAPAARANAKPITAGADHVVDGGYYDNYGITSLLGWLENAIQDRNFDPTDLQDVLILQIRPFSEHTAAAPAEVGWGFQSEAPVKALLDVRDTGQSARDHTELALFTRAYKSQLNVWRADFFYPNDFETNDEDCGDPPLSWKLSFEQTKCITKAWKRIPADAAFRGDPDPTQCVIHYLQDHPSDQQDKKRSSANLSSLRKTESASLKNFCKTGDD